ncbi:MAG: sigma-70 family RNA polymerase sigma factor [Bacteroidia bacterium]|nr:sigma-70 family RNA polymerase sigma factor [Bacteroidia bacterium]HQV01453.1 sigma-70 family RNA polymerase sigma factor [Bacteroidia bacterium]
MVATQNDLLERTVFAERKRLFSFIRNKVATDEEAEDILQDVFYELTETVRMTKPIERVAAWLFTVARNKITDRYRKKKPEALANLAAQGTNDEGESFFLTDLLSQQSDNADTNLLRKTIMIAIQEALAELPQEQRNVFVWHELDDMSFNDIAEKTGVSVNTLLSRKRYAIMHLRKKLKHLYDEL